MGWYLGLNWYIFIIGILGELEGEISQHQQHKFDVNIPIIKSYPLFQYAKTTLILLIYLMCVSNQRDKHNYNIYIVIIPLIYAAHLKQARGQMEFIENIFLDRLHVSQYKL